MYGKTNLLVFVDNGVLADLLAIVRGSIGRRRDADGGEKRREDGGDFGRPGL